MYTNPLVILGLLHFLADEFGGFTPSWTLAHKLAAQVSALTGPFSGIAPVPASAQAVEDAAVALNPLLLPLVHKAPAPAPAPAVK